MYSVAFIVYMGSLLYEMVDIAHPITCEHNFKKKMFIK